MMQALLVENQLSSPMDNPLALTVCAISQLDGFTA